MFALWMFGNQLENIWGGKRFLIYYMLTGFTALLHLGVNQFQIYMLEAQMSPDRVSMVLSDGCNALKIDRTL